MICLRFWTKGTLPNVIGSRKCYNVVLSAAPADDRRRRGLTDKWTKGTDDGRHDGWMTRDERGRTGQETTGDRQRTTMTYRRYCFLVV